MTSGVPPLRGIQYQDAHHRIKLRIDADDGMNTWSLAASMFLEGEAQTRDGVLVGAQLHGHVHLKKTERPTGALLEEGNPEVSLIVEQR